ncbi:NfeD family protein [Petroclostridium sp. X23]|uniref:NfeD family protein n=1 Tax=Petroclostridium sp. X23 TaxID=3045146 RepID=UPI0024AD358A|nr:NfeD family protein [Petroclostridium sp. X23]WHH60323.1 NfeD family protein [Petroclostridium sp. X23]
MLRAYQILFIIGVSYTLLSSILGSFLDSFDLGGDIDPGVDVPWLNISPLKPIVIMSFITVFGGVGWLGSYRGWSSYVIFIAAVFSGFIIAFILFRLVLVPLYKIQDNQKIASHRYLIGTPAKVISPIMEKGFGTISYMFNGNKYTAPCRDIDNRYIGAGKEVIIHKIEKNTFYVAQLNDIKVKERV